MVLGVVVVIGVGVVVLVVVGGAVVGAGVGRDVVAVGWRTAGTVAAGWRNVAGLDGNCVGEVVEGAGDPAARGISVPTDVVDTADELTGTVVLFCPGMVASVEAGPAGVFFVEEDDAPQAEANSSIASKAAGAKLAQVGIEL